MERENHNLPEPGEDFGVIDRQMLQRMLRDTMLIEAEKRKLITILRSTFMTGR